MALRKGLEALGIWFKPAPQSFLVSSKHGLPHPRRPTSLPCVMLPPGLSPRHCVCKGLSKCQLWSKYHRAVFRGSSLGLALGTFPPSLSSSRAPRG